MRITKTIWTEEVIQKLIRAIFIEVNFRIFIEATVMQIATISLTIQFLFENHHPKQTPSPTTMLIPSITLKSNPFTFIPIFKKSNLSSQINSLKHKPTPRVPKIQERTSTQTFTAYKLKAAITPPIIRRMLKPIIHRRVTVTPLPPTDQAFEYIATTVIKIVQKTISINRPHSKVFVVKELSQITLYVKGARF